MATRTKRAKADKPVFIDPFDDDWDDTVLECAPEVVAPAGWRLLPGGVRRSIHVSQPALRHEYHACFKVSDGGSFVYGFEVKTLGPVSLVRAVVNKDAAGCGDGSAWVETDGAVLVRELM